QLLDPADNRLCLTGSLASNVCRDTRPSRDLLDRLSDLYRRRGDMADIRSRFRRSCRSRAGLRLIPAGRFPPHLRTTLHRLRATVERLHDIIHSGFESLSRCFDLLPAHFRVPGLVRSFALPRNGDVLHRLAEYQKRLSHAPDLVTSLNVRNSPAK